jgi:seryl-tRNA synthetase
MLRIKDIRENPDVIIKKLNNRGEDFTDRVKNIIKLDILIKEKNIDIENLRAKRNNGEIIEKKY